MNWLTNFVKPKLSALVKRKDVPENLWQNCPKCGSMIHHKDLRENLNVCNLCNHHFRMSVEDRINLLFTKEDTIEIELDKISDDPLNFTDKKTKAGKAFLENLKISNALIITSIDNVNAFFSLRNIKDISIIDHKEINPYILMKHDNVVIDNNVLDHIKKATTL